MRKRLLYLLSGMGLVAFTLGLVWVISGFLEETTFEESIYVLEVNESVSLDESNVRVTRIVYSPCPDGSQCIWSGLAATFQVENGLSEERQIMEGGNETINGVQIELLEVQPESVRVRLYGM